MSGSFSYLPGRVWACCDRCSRKLAHADLRKEWTQLLVCSDCFDPRPAELTPPMIDPAEGAPIRNPRPRPADVFLSDGDVTADDL